MRSYGSRHSPTSCADCSTAAAGRIGRCPHHCCDPARPAGSQPPTLTSSPSDTAIHAISRSSVVFAEQPPERRLELFAGFALLLDRSKQVAVDATRDRGIRVTQLVGHEDRITTLGVRM